MGLPSIFCVVIVAFLLGCSRTSEFQAQAQAGKPIVRAIDEYQKQTGNYPTSLTNLVPKYLPAVPDIAEESKHKLTGWDYRMVTNGSHVSYTLRCYMGRGGIEYQPPDWISNDEGHRTVILTVTMQ
jgi:hypothetical protein